VSRRAAGWLGALLGAVTAAGCGLQVAAPDLFAITRTGPGGAHTVVVNDSGSVRCDRGRARPIPSATLIAARDLADNLGSDAGRHLTLPSPAGTASTFTIRMPQGTIRFPDRAGGAHRELAAAELFFLQAQADC
jgi:hypothetical protein